MTFSSKALLTELATQKGNLATFADTLLSLPEPVLRYRPNATSWNVLECLEHLNRYSDFYLPAVRTAIKAANRADETSYKSGWLGNYFVKSMESGVKEKKIKTFKDKDPMGAPLDRAVVRRFKEDQTAWCLLLEEAGVVSLSRTKVPISIMPWLKLNLGDVLRFVTTHEVRHQLQITRILKDSGLSS